MFPQKSPFCPLFGPFYPHFAIPSAWESGRGQSLSGTQGTSVATFAPGTTVGPQPRSARSTPGEPGRAADRQVFASLSYPTNRQVLRNPHVGRPGFLVLARFARALHTAIKKGRGAHTFSCGRRCPAGADEGMRCAPWPANCPHPAVPATFS